MHACMYYIYYNMMASLCCAYAKLVGGSCGASTSNPSEATIRDLRKRLLEKKYII